MTLCVVFVACCCSACHVLCCCSACHVLCCCWSMSCHVMCCFWCMSCVSEVPTREPRLPPRVGRIKGRLRVYACARVEDVCTHARWCLGRLACSKVRCKRRQTRAALVSGRRGRGRGRGSPRGRGRDSRRQRRVVTLVLLPLQPRRFLQTYTASWARAACPSGHCTCRSQRTVPTPLEMCGTGS